MPKQVLVWGDSNTNFSIYIKPILISIWFHISRYRYLLSVSVSVILVKSNIGQTIDVSSTMFFQKPSWTILQTRCTNHFKLYSSVLCKKNSCCLVPIAKGKKSCRLVPITVTVTLIVEVGMCCSSMGEWWYEPSWSVNCGPNLIQLISKGYAQIVSDVSVDVSEECRLCLLYVIFVVHGCHIWQQINFLSQYHMSMSVFISYC